MGDIEPEQPRVYRGEAKLGWMKNLKPGQKVTYEHIDGVPVGDQAMKLSAFAGKLAKDGHYFPFDVLKWPDIPDLPDVIERVKDEMKNVFHWHEESHYWLYQTLSDTWRKNKSQKKTDYFKTKNTLEDQYANCPPGMVHAQWENMVTYWRTPESEEVAERNTDNREQLTEHHTSGSKSYMRHAREIEVETNQPATRMGIFGRTRTKSDTGKQKFEEMKVLKMKAEENGVVESLEQLDGDSYSQAMGRDKRGRYRGVGNCIKPKKRSRGEYSSTSKTEEKLKSLEEHIVVINQDRDELRKVNVALQQSNEETNQKMDKMIDILKLICPNQDIAAMISGL